MENRGAAEPCGISIDPAPLSQPPAIIAQIHKAAEEDGQAQGKERYLKQIEEWEYCYCPNCRQIRFSSELEATSEGVRCQKCQSVDLEAPGWVACPHYKDSVVKCPRAGRGIVHQKSGPVCTDHCNFRLAD